MFHLITGGSGSGKSAYAEAQTLQYAGRQVLHISGQNPGKELPCLYIATMKPYGEETLQKIESHRMLRAGKGFVTIECYKELDRAVIPKNSGILLECLSNLAANELYGEDGAFGSRQEAAERILGGIQYILSQTDYLVIVTNEVGLDVGNYSYETREYIALMGTINQRLACMADKVTEVVYGIPVPVKG